MKRSPARKLLTASVLFAAFALSACCSLAAAPTPIPTPVASPATQPSPLTAGFTLQPLHFEVQHPYNLKLEDRYSYDKPSDTQDLWVLFTDKPHAPPPNRTTARTEIRIQDDDYKPGSGLHMLDCDLYIVPGTYACISQVFGTGPMAMIVVDPNGTITDLGGRTVIAKNMNGKWFNWKIIHDTSATGRGAIKIYIDDKLVDPNMNARKQSSYYFKVGVYSRKNSDRSGVKIRNLQYWIKEPSASATQPAADSPRTSPQK